MANSLLPQLLAEVKAAANSIKTSKFKEVLVLHHNDTDGLSSGAILTKAFLREKMVVRRYALEKPYPLVLKTIFDGEIIDQGQLIVITDFGSGMLSELSSINNKRYNVLILDHHAINGNDSEKIKIVNPLNHNISGNDCSASALCYQFVESLNEWNKDLSHIGALGAIGDGFIVNGRLEGVNQLSLDSAISQKLISMPNFTFLAAENFAEKLSENFAGAEITKVLDALGSIGYFKGGPDIAIKGLIDGDYKGIFTLAKPFQDEMEKEFQEFESKIQLSRTSSIQWFNLKDSFSNFGVKTVGLLCQRLRDQSHDRGLVEDDKYIAGFQYVPDEIPGLGNFPQGITKISMRVPNKLKVEIEKGKALDLTKILSPATRKVGGVVDACHKFAAATTVPIGKEEELIKYMDEIISA